MRPRTSVISRTSDPRRTRRYSRIGRLVSEACVIGCGLSCFICSRREVVRTSTVQVAVSCCSMQLHDGMTYLYLDSEAARTGQIPRSGPVHPGTGAKLPQGR